MLIPVYRIGETLIIGIEIIPLEVMRYAPAKDKFLPVSQIEEQGLESSEYIMKKDLAMGEEVQVWFSDLEMRVKTGGLTPMEAATIYARRRIPYVLSTVS